MNTLTDNKPVKKTTQATESLRRLVDEIGPDAKLPTYLELLSSLSVSRTTLNAALDELEGQRVIYRRHGVGIFTAPRQRCQTIAVVCNPHFFQGKNHSPFWDVLLSGTRERAAQDAFACEVHFCKNNEPDTLTFSDNLLHSLRSGYVHGVVGIGMNRAARRWLAENDTPYVSFGGPGQWYVGVDRVTVIQLGVQTLAELGCRRIAMLSPVIPFKTYSTPEEDSHIRIEIFRTALEHFGLPFYPQLALLNLDLVAEGSHTTTLSLQEQGFHSVHQAYASGEGPDGLLFGNDVMAVGGMAALRELHLNVGQDVQVATHSNKGTTLLTPYEDVLIRLEVDPTEIVDTLFSAIRDLMAGETPTQFEMNPVTHDMQYIVRSALRRPGEHSG